MYITEAANYLRLSEATLKRWDKSGKLVPERRGKRGDRWYPKPLLDKFLKYQENYEPSR